MSDKESAIEQIAKDIFISDNSNSQDPEKEWDNALAADRGYARHIARGMHSLGYTNNIVHQCCVDAEASKPRIITTVEELEALPDLSVILDVDRDVSQLRGSSWCGYEMADLTHPMMAKCLPATILWEPLP